MINYFVFITWFTSQAENDPIWKKESFQLNQIQFELMKKNYNNANIKLV